MQVGGGLVPKGGRRMLRVCTRVCTCVSGLRLKGEERGQKVESVAGFPQAFASLWK